MERIFVAERSVSRATGVERWVVADARTYGLHVEACAFLAGLRSKGRSPNTERVYAGRLALYLNYCAEQGIEWAGPGFLALSGLQQWLVGVPLPARGRRSAGVAAVPRYRSRGTANAVMTAVADFLRFGALHGWVSAETAGVLSEPKFLRFLPAGYDPGERGQWRQVQVSAFRFPVSEPGYEDLSAEQIRRMIADAPRARDRFLVALLAATGLRIGEALGLRREDLHLLASSRSVGCPVEGPHLHVRRRLDNPNGALAKSRRSRVLPVTADLVWLYTDYQHERSRVAEAAQNAMVFVNLYRPPLGRAMTYPNAKGVFDRLARRAGHPARPHMLRHCAATRWLREGVDRDVVQELLGHASPLSMDRYRHVDESETRAAVDRVQAWREHR
jgi:integrase